MSRFIASLAALSLVLVAVVGVAWAPARLLRDPEASPVTASGGTIVTASRGDPAGWYTVEYPDDWILGGYSSPYMIQSVAGEVPPGSNWAKLEVSPGDWLSDVRDGPFPPGTLTSTMSIDGLEAVLVELPPWNTDGVTTTKSYIEIQDLELQAVTAQGAFYMTEYVFGAPDQATLLSMQETTREIATGFDFLDDHTKLAEWTATSSSSPLIPGVESFAIEHPADWTVTDTGSVIAVSGPALPPFGAGPVSIEIEPGLPVDSWLEAETLLGSALMRLGPSGSQSSGGFVTTEYLVHGGQDNADRVTVAVPELAFGTSDYWLYEQTAWAIALRAEVWVDEKFDPYP